MVKHRPEPGAVNRIGPFLNPEVVRSYISLCTPPFALVVETGERFVVATREPEEKEEAIRAAIKAWLALGPNKLCEIVLLPKVMVPEPEPGKDEEELAA